MFLQADALPDTHLTVSVHQRELRALTQSSWPHLFMIHQLIPQRRNVAPFMMSPQSRWGVYNEHVTKQQGENWLPMATLSTTSATDSSKSSSASLAMCATVHNNHVLLAAP